MRIVRLKLKPAVMEALEEIAALYSIEDSGFAEDLFALFRMFGSGLPSDERLESMADVYAAKANLPRGITLMHMRKRKYTLQELTKLPLFKALCLDCVTTPHVAVKRLLQTFREFSRKRRQASCLSCSLRSNCDFGKQYGELVNDVSRVVDPSYEKKLHPDCPDRPAIVSINMIYEELMKFRQLNATTAQGQAVAALTPEGDEFLKALEAAEEAFDEESDFIPQEDTSVDDPSDQDLEEMADNNIDDFGGSAGKGGASRPGTHAGKHFAKVSEDFVNNLSVQALQLFELGRQLDEMLKAELGEKFKPTKEVSRDQRVKRLQESNEVSHVASNEHALPDDHFDAKLVKRDLTVQSFAKPEEKKHLLYVLIDESGSMNSQICEANDYSFITRGQTATTLAGALCKRVGDDGGMMFLRFFSDSPGPMTSARTKTEFDAMLRDVINADINGGGTSIIRALRRAHNDISTSASEIAKAEVLLITDMDDEFQADEVKWIQQTFTPDGVKLNVLNVNSARYSYGNAHTVLAQVATKYLQVNPKTLDIKSIVELVK